MKIDLLEADKPAAAAPASLTPAHILAEAAADVPAAPGAPVLPGIVPLVPALNHAADANDLVEFAGDLFFPIYPQLAGVYTPDHRRRIADRLAPVMKKYNVDLGALGPEIMLAVALVPLIVPTVAAIRAGRAADNAPAKAGAPDPVDPGAAVLSEKFPGLNG